MEAAVQRNQFLKKRLEELKGLQAESKKPLPKASEVKAAFEEFDLDGSGYIEVDEFALLCTALDRPLDDSALHQTLSLLDTDGDGRISFHEFLQWWMQSEGEPGSPGFLNLQILRARLLARRSLNLVRRISSSGKVEAGNDKHMHLNASFDFGASPSQQPGAKVVLELKLEDLLAQYREQLPGEQGAHVCIDMRMAPNRGPLSDTCRFLESLARPLLRSADKARGVTVHAFPVSEEQRRIRVVVGLPVPDPLAMLRQVEVSLQQLVSSLRVEMDFWHPVSEVAVQERMPVSEMIPSAVRASATLNSEFARLVLDSKARLTGAVSAKDTNALVLQALQRGELVVSFARFDKLAEFTVANGETPEKQAEARMLLESSFKDLMARSIQKQPGGKQSMARLGMGVFSAVFGVMSRDVEELLAVHAVAKSGPGVSLSFSNLLKPEALAALFDNIVV